MNLKNNILLGAVLATLGIYVHAESVDRVVVKLKPSLMMRSASSDDVKTSIRAASGGQATHTMTMGDGVSQVLQLPKGLSGAALQAYLQKLQASGEFESVEADVRMYPMGVAVPNDSYWSQMWDFQPVLAGSVYGADYPGAWAFTTGDGVVVAVVDTGAVPHPDLGGLSPVGGNFVSPGYTFISDCYRAGTCDWTTASRTIKPFAGALDQGDWCTTQDVSNQVCDQTETSSFHGSHVSGTIAALGYNGSGVIGGAYNAKILPVRVLGKGGGSAIDIADGIRWAAGVHPTIPNPNPAKVINMSLGGSSNTCPSFYQSAIDDATRAGAIVVVAAGNEKRDASLATPANCNNVITVGATGKSGERASYSNFGSKVTLAAPGGNGSIRILSTVNLSPARVDLSAAGAGYVGMNGTSMATPHVAAAVALMMSANPKLKYSDVVSLLRQSATAFPQTSCTTSTCGAGILNAAAAVRLAKQSAGDGTEPVVTPVPVTPTPTPTKPPVVTPVPVTPTPTKPPVVTPIPVTPPPTKPPVVTPVPTAPPAACFAAWTEGKTYTTADRVTYLGRNYSATTTHTAYVGANWNPKASITLWKDIGACSGANVTPVPVTPTAAPIVTPTIKPTVTPVPSITPSVVPSAVPTPAPSNCPAWLATATYTAGQCVSYNGKTYAAKWWTRGEAPEATQWGPWVAQAVAGKKR